MGLSLGRCVGLAVHVNELRWREQRGRLRDYVGAAQFPQLALELLHPLKVVGGHTRLSQVVHVTRAATDEANKDAALAQSISTLPTDAPVQCRTAHSKPRRRAWA